MDIMTCPHCRQTADRPVFLPTAQQQTFDHIWNNPWCTVEEIEIALFSSSLHSNLVAVNISKIRDKLTDTPFKLSTRDGPSNRSHRPHKQYAIESANAII